MVETMFDFTAVEVSDTELYVALGSGKTPPLNLVTSDDSIREALTEALIETVNQMNKHEPVSYDASNHYPTGILVHAYHANIYPVEKHLYFHEDRAWPELPNPATNLKAAKAYIARFRDTAGQRITAVCKVDGMQVSLSKRKVAFLRGGALQIDETQRFELHNIFDFLVDDAGLNIYQVKRFEGVCLMHQAINDAAQENFGHLSEAMPFVDIETLQAHTRGSMRSARALASIRANGYGHSVDQAKLEARCTNARIGFEYVDGKLVVDPSSAGLFLSVIARKILESDISSDGIEVFSVSVRQSLP